MKTQWPANYQTLCTWWQTPTGQACLEFEKNILQERLNNLFGYQLLLLADDTFADCAMNSRILNCTRINPLQQTHIQFPDNIDVVIIPHWIFYFPHLQPLLASLWHSLMNGGSLLITGYDTWHFLGLELFSKKGQISEIAPPIFTYQQMKKALINEEFVIEHANKYRQPQTRMQLTHIEAIKKLAVIKKLKPQWRLKSAALAPSVLSHSSHTTPAMNIKS